MRENLVKIRPGGFGDMLANRHTDIHVRHSTPLPGGCGGVAEPFIIIIDKTDAGLNGLCIRDITLLCDVINMCNND